MKYVAELAHLREVSLLGSADLGFWAEQLKGEGLTPVEHAGRARVLVVACDSKFFGVRFRELSFSVFVHHASGGVGRPAPSAGFSVFVRRSDASEGSDAAFLVQAFNSSRFFAWSERTWFSTSYRHGMIDVEIELPAAMRLGLEGQTVFSAVMSEESSQAAGSGDPRRAQRRPESRLAAESKVSLGRSFCREAHAERRIWDDCSSPRSKARRKPIRSPPRTR